MKTKKENMMTKNKIGNLKIKSWKKRKRKGISGTARRKETSTGDLIHPIAYRELKVHLWKNGFLKDQSNLALMSIKMIWISIFVVLNFMLHQVIDKVSNVNQLNGRSVIKYRLSVVPDY